MTSPEMTLIVTQMIEASIPQVYWIGYNNLSLVSAEFISRWSLAVSKEPIVNVFPRRWLDIRGVRVPDFWQAALRAVMGLIIFRPGIPQVRKNGSNFRPPLIDIFNSLKYGGDCARYMTDRRSTKY